MNLLRLDEFNHEIVRELAPSFHNLPSTEHKDGEYRLRRYSVIELMLEPKAIKALPINSFMQTDKYNDFQGNVERKFENIDESALYSDGMKEIIYQFRMVNSLPHTTLVEIHQMRIVTLYEETPISPEGVHQDGNDFIATVGIARHNIEGGHLLVYMEKDEEPFIYLPLEAGYMVTMDDKKLWHHGRPIKSLDQNSDGYMDVFILTTKVANKLLAW